MIWRGFVVLAILLVGVLSVMMGRRGEQPEQAAPAREPLQPGYYMTDARITDIGADGKPVVRIESDRIVQKPTDSSIVLSEVDVVYNADEDVQWTLTAAQGVVPPNSRQIHLSGDVRIRGRPRPASVPGVIRTESLTLDTEKSVASTHSRVDIEWGDRRLSAMGLHADLKAERLRLESSVHGRFVR
jgi:LPS export ABC transporter protein LptC